MVVILEYEDNGTRIVFAKKEKKSKDSPWIAPACKGQLEDEG